MSDVILYGTLPNGEAVRVEANESGQLVAEGLQGQPGEPGQPGQPGQQGPPGAPGPPGDIYEQLPPDPWEGAILGWEAGELAWLGDEPIILPPQTIGPLVAVDNEMGKLTSETEENFENLLDGLDVFMSDRHGVLKTFSPSTDPVTEVEELVGGWTASPASESNTWQSVAYGDGKFVAVASEGNNRVMHSDDGIHWKPTNSATQDPWEQVCFGDGKFVAVSAGSNYPIMYSTDGIKWLSANGAPKYEWAGVAYGGGKFVAVGKTGNTRALYSDDGVTWHEGVGAPKEAFTAVTYADGKFVAVGTYGTNRTMLSTDGINWTPNQAPAGDNWHDIAYGNGRFVAVANYGTNRVMYSIDGVTWAFTSVPELNPWYAVCFGDGKFVAVADSGTNQVMTSEDGVSWTPGMAGEESGWDGICYGDGKFVAVASYGTNRTMWSFSGTSDSQLKLTVKTTEGGFLPEMIHAGDTIRQISTDGGAVVALIEEEAIYADIFWGTFEVNLPVETEPKSGTGTILGNPSATKPDLFLRRTNYEWYAGDIYVTQAEAKVAKRIIAEQKLLQQQVKRGKTRGTRKS